MKKVVWSGFCLIAGILLFWMFSTISIHNNSNIPEMLLKTLAAVLGIYGLVSGFIGLKKD